MPTPVRCHVIVDMQMQFNQLNRASGLKVVNASVAYANNGIGKTANH